MNDKNAYIKLQSDLNPFMGLMAKASDTVIEQGVSHYPILVVHQAEIQLGINIKETLDNQADWAINISTLEEFVSKQIIKNDKIEDFKKIYKSPDKNLSLFVVDKNGATFVFLPRSN